MFRIKSRIAIFSLSVFNNEQQGRLTFISFQLGTKTKQFTKKKLNPWCAR